VFNYTYLHDYDVLMTENYTLEVTLPYGARDIKMDVPIEIDSYTVESNSGTLDFFGKPKLVVRKLNVHYSLHNVNFSVTYRYDPKYMLIKPLVFSGVVFMVYLLAIVLQRT
jgi:hypothetical protein